MKEQSLNYQLTYRQNHYKQNADRVEKRIGMLQDKLKYMTSTLNKQIRDQGERANEVDVETKKMKQEIIRQKEEVALKIGELKKLDDSNALIKKAGYDRNMEELGRKLSQLEY